ncbi:MAG: helix-turn-helix transcriptional regulator [Oscillibacter sp.]|nr:helix-turn-helix transcriptional regulator [Oscillibacter sp.]
MSQGELGRLLGVTATQIGDMERGNSTTSMPRLYQLCQYFEVSSDYLMGLTDDPSPR